MEYSAIDQGNGYGAVPEGDTSITTFGTIMDKANRAKDFTKGFHDNIEHWRKLYKFDHYVRSPLPTESQYADPTFTNTVDLAVGILQSNSMIWKAVGWTPSQAEQRGSDKIEKYLSGLIEMNSSRNEYSIPYEVNLHFVRDGGAVLFSVWDPELAQDLIDETEIETPEGERVLAPVFKEPPLTIKVIDPLSISVLPGGPKRWCAVIRREKMMVKDAEDLYGVNLDFITPDPNTKYSTPTELIDYWDYAYLKNTPVEENYDQVMNFQEKRKLVVRNAIIIGGQFAKGLRVMPGYTDIPYTISFFKPTSRSESDGWASIISPMEPTVFALEKAINRRQRQIDVFSQLPFIIRSNTNKNIQMDPGIGKTITLDKDEDAGFATWQGNPPDVKEQIAFFRARAQQSGFSDVMYGEGPSAISGFALSQMADQNRIRLEQPIEHLEKFWTWWAKKVLELSSYYAEGLGVVVYGTRKGTDFAELVQGSELKGFNVRCEIKAEFPNEKVRNHAMATQARGVVSDYTLLQEYYGIQQPQDEIDRRLVEAMQSNPIAIQYGVLAHLEKAARSGDKIAAIVLEKMTMELQMAEQAKQQKMSNPEQPMGIQGADGQAPPQAEGQSPMAGGSQGEEIQRMGGLAPNMSGGVG